MYLIVETEEQKLERANRENKSKRRCKIGKVWMKPPKHWKLLDALKGQPIYPNFPLINEFPPPLPRVPTITTPNTCYPPAWWQNPVVSTC